MDLTAEVVELLGQHWAECGKPADDVLVFSTGSGPIAPSTFCRGILYPAMKRAGVERVGPTGEKRTWHSLRHSYARIALEHEAPIFWLSRQLGHSSVQVTQDVYGHWSRKARKAEVQKLAGAFSGLTRTDRRTDRGPEKGPLSLQTRFPPSGPGRSRTSAHGFEVRRSIH